MANKNIKIGAIRISEWTPKDGKMFSWDFYYNKNDEFYCDEYAESVEMCPPKEVVLPPNKEYTLVIDYPVSNPYKAKLKTGKRGLTRLQLADKICKHYRKMYAIEDGTAGGDPGHIPGMLNRARSNGKYGIWGHGIGDLVLCDATVKPNGNIFLGVDS